MTAAAPPSSLGRDLKALRRARGLTLQAMADSLGRSVGWLSQVERDKSRAGIDDLRAIAALLGVPISTLFGTAPARPGEEGHVVRKGARRPIGSGKAGLTEELLSPDLTDDFEVVHSVFESGAALPRAVTRPTQEVGYVVSGNLTLEIGENTFILRPGDSFRIRGEPFRWSNPGTTPATVIWVIAPPVY